jgi:spoIIIJ-associated protein
MSIEEQATLAHEFVAGLVERLDITASTSVATSEELDTIEVSIEGDGLGLLIGPHGATLGALQELTRTVVQRHTNEHSARVIVDVAGYRAKRAAALAQFAQRIADEVRASGTPHALEPMSASDRKIVHDTVNELDSVATSSEGEGDSRHVVIRPTAPPAAEPDALSAPDASSAPETASAPDASSAAETASAPENPGTRGEQTNDSDELGEGADGDGDGYQAGGDTGEVTDAR